MKKTHKNGKPQNLLEKGRNISIRNSEQWMHCPKSSLLAENKNRLREEDIFGFSLIRNEIVDFLNDYFLKGRKPSFMNNKPVESMNTQEAVVAYTFETCALATQEIIESTLSLTTDGRYPIPEFDKRVSLPDIDKGILGRIDMFLSVPEAETAFVLLYSPWTSGVFQPGIWTDIESVLLPKYKLMALAVMRDYPDIDTVIFQVFKPFAPDGEAEWEHYYFEKSELETWLTTEAMSAYAKTQEKEPTGHAGFHCLYCPHVFSCNTLDNFISDASCEEAELMSLKMDMWKSMTDINKETRSDKGGPDGTSTNYN